MRPMKAWRQALAVVVAWSPFFYAEAAAAAGRARAVAPVQVLLMPLERQVEFPSAVDSNSPLFWNDLNEMVLFTSFGHPFFSVGPELARMAPVAEVGWATETPGAKWLESVIRAGDGTLYGYYHLEPPDLCLESGQVDLTEPQIGAAVSLDDGQTWRDLGIVLTARPGYLRCDTANSYFAGGVGDFSVVLDQEQRYAYFFFTTYAGESGEQGVCVARLLWAERDRPVPKVVKFFDGLWLEPGLGGRATAIFPAMPRWDELDTDAFWGPSVHWNTQLQAHVMLLNHDLGTTFSNEGIYVAFSFDLDDPSLWTNPEMIIEGGDWYPQVVGLEQEKGTDARAGREAWLCVRGRCSFRVVFQAADAGEQTARAGAVVSAPRKTAPVAARHGPTRSRRRGRAKAR